jgi:hypothetical protein
MAGNAIVAQPVMRLEEASEECFASCRIVPPMPGKIAYPVRAIGENYSTPSLLPPFPTLVLDQR